MSLFRIRTAKNKRRRRFRSNLSRSHMLRCRKRSRVRRRESIQLPWVVKPKRGSAGRLQMRSHFSQGQVTQIRLGLGRATFPAPKMLPKSRCRLLLSCRTGKTAHIPG